MKRMLFTAAALAALAPCGALAHPGPHADSHAPLGVMGEHTHDKGEFMVSYRYMRMDMEGSRIGNDSVTPEFIAQSVPSLTGMPPTLRVVPTEMTMDMHMFGAMWAPTDSITLMAMAPYLEKDMDHVTFHGMAGANRLGVFNTRSSGFGDVSLSALFKVAGEGDSDAGRRTVMQIGVSLPTGSIDETDDVLTPMNTRPTLTLPYAMQLGSGTVDPFAALTYAWNGADWGWGAQARAKLRLYDNDQDYRLGNEISATSWVSYSPARDWSFSLRAEAKNWGEIDGQDSRIAAPVQTADPGNYGGTRIDALFGVNWAAQGALSGHRLALEVGAPILQDLNGPQMETDLTVTLGWQFSFGG